VLAELRNGMSAPIGDDDGVACDVARNGAGHIALPQQPSRDCGCVSTRRSSETESMGFVRSHDDLECPGDCVQLGFCELASEVLVDAAEMRSGSATEAS
jgi:hypothetical protein